MNAYKNLWVYQSPIWLSYYKGITHFGILPKEVIEIIINILMKDIIIQRAKIENIKNVREQIVYMFNNNIENFHFKKGTSCDMDIVKSILQHTSRIQNKPIKIQHECCSGDGLMFYYKEFDDDDEENENYENDVIDINYDENDDVNENSSLLVRRQIRKAFNRNMHNISKFYAALR